MTNFLFASFEALTGLPEFIAYIFVFLFGAAIGSFLNVVIYRVPNELSVVFPNSACPKCKAPIKAYDNIPVLSWLILRGKCRGCGEKISAQYPIVELLTALLFVLFYWQIGLNPFLPVCLLFAAVIIALIFIDAEHMILPDVITLPFWALMIVIRVVFGIVFGAAYFSDLNFAPLTWMHGYPVWLISLVGAILGGLAGGGSLWLIGAIWKLLTKREAMGFGDVKMMAGVGALLGWRLSFLSIFMGAFSGAIIGVVLIAKQKDKDLQTQIPFGIFLGIGSIIALLFGEHLIRWYVAIFVP